MVETIANSAPIVRMMSGKKNNEVTMKCWIFFCLNEDVQRNDIWLVLPSFFYRCNFRIIINTNMDILLVTYKECANKGKIN